MKNHASPRHSPRKFLCGGGRSLRSEEIPNPNVKGFAGMRTRRIRTACMRAGGSATRAGRHARGPAAAAAAAARIGRACRSSAARGPHRRRSACRDSKAGAPVVQMLLAQARVPRVLARASSSASLAEQSRPAALPPLKFGRLGARRLRRLRARRPRQGCIGRVTHCS